MPSTIKKINQTTNIPINDLRQYKEIGQVVLHGSEGGSSSFAVSAKTSSKVHKLTLAGAAVTIMFTPRDGTVYADYISFMTALGGLYCSIGQKAVNLFGRVVYSLQFDCNFSKGHESFSLPFVVFPCENDCGKQVYY